MTILSASTAEDGTVTAINENDEATSAPPGHGLSQEWLDGGVEIAEYVAPVMGYAARRRAAYAKISDQLDMQYHDAANGTTTWVDHVAEVKAAHPKS